MAINITKPVKQLAICISVILGSALSCTLHYLHQTLAPAPPSIITPISPLLIDSTVCELKVPLRQQPAPLSGAAFSKSFVNSSSLVGNLNGIPIPSLPDASGKIKVLGVLPPDVAIMRINSKTITVRKNTSSELGHFDNITANGVTVSGNHYSYIRSR